MRRNRERGRRRLLGPQIVFVKRLERPPRVWNPALKRPSTLLHSRCHAENFQTWMELNLLPGGSLGSIPTAPDSQREASERQRTHTCKQLPSPTTLQLLLAVWRKKKKRKERDGVGGGEGVLDHLQIPQSQGRGREEAVDTGTKAGNGLQGPVLSQGGRGSILAWP